MTGDVSNPRRCGAVSRLLARDVGAKLPWHPLRVEVPIGVGLQSRHNPASADVSLPCNDLKPFAADSCETAPHMR